LRDDLAQYQVETPILWQGMPVRGLDGYGVAELVRRWDWEAIADWGKDGYNLGSWPLVIVFWRDHEGGFDVAEYVEGDATVYTCPTEEIREQITDEIAYFHWRHTDKDWTRPYHWIENLPNEFKGPYEGRKTEGAYYNG
jgi:hypothetical protein